jgi:hypothetical protein
MFNSKKFMSAILLVLLAAAPILAATSGSGRFGVTKKLLASGTEIKPGEYNAKWKSNGSDATVTLMMEGKAPIVLKGKLVTGDKKFEWNSMLVGKNSSGDDVLKALQFGGQKTSVVFE